MAKNIIETIQSERTDAMKRAPLPLGLKLLSAIFSINIVITLIILIFSSRDLVEYDAANLFDWLNLVFEAVTLWMVWYRLKITRPFALAYTVFNVVVGTAVHLGMHTMDVVLQLASVIPDVVIFLYFLLSKKAREVLTEDLVLDTMELQGEDGMAPRWSWPFVRNLIMYFCIFSFLGHWMEMSFCLAIKAGLVGGEYDPSNTMLWRDWFYPFPMHGMAVVLIGVLLYPLWRMLVRKTNVAVGSLLSFVINGLMCGLIEFTFGLLWNADLQNWDYTNMPFNFMGQVCLQNVIGFAFAASIIAWMVYPWLERMLAKLPEAAVNITSVVVLMVFLVAQTLYLVEPPIDYRTELEYALAEDDRDPSYLTDEERASYEEELAYLDYLDAYKAENQARLERERAEQAAEAGKD
ncbi:MAG: putative ABC transporter permease [Atopobiaceae bacterium]|nr:putative ABC transporter permease [Atopobiaceae bacterium]